MIALRFLNCLKTAASDILLIAESVTPGVGSVWTTKDQIDRFFRDATVTILDAYTPMSS